MSEAAAAGTTGDDAVRPDVEIVAHVLADDGEIPNNARCALLLYRGAVALSGRDPAAIFERLFDANRWPAAWRDGVFPFHHFHSTAHEALGVYSGEADVLLGGEHGVRVTVVPGDVVVIPAGVGHKRVGVRGRLGIVGAYPAGQVPDMCRPPCGAPERDNVSRVALPAADPVHGPDGPLLSRWRG